MFTNSIKVIFGSVIIILLFFAVWNPIWSNGDEVHYLTVSSSLISDRDFNLENNYINRDYFSHHADPVDPHVLPSQDSHSKPFHGILLSIALIPGYYADNLTGSRINMLVYVLIGVYFLYLLLKELGFSKNIGLLTLSLFLIQAPIIFFSSSIYPDFIMGFMLVISGYFNLKGIKASNKYYFLASGIVSGINIFFHWKILAFSLLLFGSTLIVNYTKNQYYFNFNQKNNLSLPKLFSKNYSSELKILTNNIRVNKQIFITRVIYGLVPILFFTLLASTLSYIWFGHFRPDYMTPFIKDNPEIKGYANPLFNVTAMLFDSDQGLFWSAPILPLLIPGLILWFKNNKHTFVAFALPSLTFLLTQALFREWTAGWAPMARYTMTSLPLLIPALAYIIVAARKSKVLSLIICGLVLVNILYLLIIFKYKYTGYPNNNINFFLEVILNRLNLQSLIPLFSFNFNLPGIKELIFSVLMYLLFIVYGVYLIKVKSKESA